ncbi:hypothetical protein ACFS5N_05510 [Mucilaginibacter ximonensis]|uniref:Uncharacterized protein n=1 Tax=Mucilaginibacter ximonensis TaxID=538021 RepID=A0ABW5Y981_9SPHI
MNNRSPGNVDCWFVSEDEVRNAAKGIPFNPGYLVYAYFKRMNRLDDNTIEGWIGRIDRINENFHCAIDNTYTYFNDYRANKKVYVTLDKTVFYEISEIFPLRPLLFLLKKVDLKTEFKNPVTTPIPITVHRLPFSVLGGENFERLIFAFLQQTEHWKKIEWHGEAGQDNGKDIWAENENGTHCFQCANYQQLTSQKAISDIEKLLVNKIIPDQLTIVCGGKVTEGLRQKIKSYAASKGIKVIAI